MVLLMCLPLSGSPVFCRSWCPGEEKDNYMPFAIMSGCLLIVMHILPKGSEAL